MHPKCLVVSEPTPCMHILPPLPVQQLRVLPACLSAQSALDQRGSGWKKRCGTRTKPLPQKPRRSPVDAAAAAAAAAARRSIPLLVASMHGEHAGSVWGSASTERTSTTTECRAVRHAVAGLLLSSNISLRGGVRQLVGLLREGKEARVEGQEREEEGRGRTGGRRRGILMLNLMPSWQQQQLVSREDKTGWREKHICLTSLNFPAGLLRRHKGHVGECHLLQCHVHIYL